MNRHSTERRVVLITGASGGFGRGLVMAFAGAGWTVVAASRQAVDDFAGAEVFSVRLDVTIPAEIDTAVDEALEKLGRIDVLINNAGIISDGPVWSLEDSDWERVMDVNLKGAFRCARAVIRPMLKQRSGHILNVASFAARTGTAGQSNYAAAKAGLIGLTQSLAREAGSRNVRVNAVLPGVMETAMTASLSTERRIQMAADNALGRWNDIAEVARFVEFLANMQNVSGQLFQLDSRIAPWT
ncbi:MAG TPA: SDR family NAD(P)-dependent oxidoreductase [Roseimicrobium sp.]|nr:SDR family NAD(P)-dependent oxidoreductase [Roseimicrobium sp.]